MARDAAGGQAVFAFDIRLFQMAGIPGRKLKTTDDINGDRVILVQASISHKVAQETCVAEPKLRAVFDDCAVRTPEFAINQRQIELDPDTSGEIVSNEQL